MNGFETIDQIKFVPLVQCLVLYLGDPWIFLMGFFLVFHTSTGKKLRENNHGNNYGMHKFDAKHSAFVVKISPKAEAYSFLWEL